METDPTASNPHTMKGTYAMTNHIGDKQRNEIRIKVEAKYYQICAQDCFHYANEFPEDDYVRDHFLKEARLYYDMARKRLFDLIDKNFLIYLDML